MTFGERLRELREEKNVTQKALAGILGVSPRMVSFYESGEHFLSDEGQLLRLADYFGVTTDYLLGRSGPDPTEQFERLHKAYLLMPEDSRKSVMDYAEYLAHKAQRGSR